MKPIRRLFPVILIALLTLANSPAASADTATIQLRITDVKPGEGGSIHVLLYDRDGWLTPKKAIRHIEIPVEDRQTYEIDLTNIPYPAIYAVQLFQDQNDNHELDMHWLPWPGPDEPYGFSNNYKPFGKPAFTKASFPLNKKRLSLQIRMRD